MQFKFLFLAATGLTVSAAAPCLLTINFGGLLACQIYSAQLTCLHDMLLIIERLSRYSVQASNTQRLQLFAGACQGCLAEHERTGIVQAILHCTNPLTTMALGQVWWSIYKYSLSLVASVLWKQSGHIAALAILLALSITMNWRWRTSRWLDFEWCKNEYVLAPFNSTLVILRNSCF
jgi:hypothetical protein